MRWGNTFFGKRTARLWDVWRHNRQLAWNVLGSGAVRCLSVAIGIFSMPAYMAYFRDNRVLGVWLALVSVLSMVSVLDFGLGNGLRNHLAAAFARGDRGEARRLISSGYALIALACLALAAAGWPVMPLLPWNRLLGIDAGSVRPEVLVLVLRMVYLALVLQMALRTVTAVLYARQQAALAGALSLVTNASLVVYALLGTRGADAGEGLVRLAAVYCLAANLPYLAANGALFFGSLREAAPSLRFFDWGLSARLLLLGLAFFYLTVASIAVHNTNEVLVAALFDSALVVEYQVYNKVFYFVVTAMNVLLVPLWSAVTKAYAEGNIPWMRRLHSLLCLSALGSLAGGCLLVPLMQPIVDLWLGERAIPIVPLYCVPFVLYVAVDAVNGANATIANGANWLRAQLVMAPVTVALNVGLTVCLARAWHHWVMIPTANVLSLVPVAVVQYVYIRRKFGRLERRRI